MSGMRFDHGRVRHGRVPHRRRMAGALALAPFAVLAALAAAAVGSSAVGPRVLAAEERLPIYDLHAHYSAPNWSAYDPPAIAAKLEAAGVLRALVSSSPDEGTRRLVQHDARRFLAELRPYRAGVTSGNWVHDAATPAYLLERLGQAPYAGIGEFHLHSAEDARTDVVRRVAALAAERGLWLQVHSDDAPVEALFALQPELRILWAHAGMVSLPAVVRRMLERHPRLWSELSYRAGDILRGDAIDPDWRALLLAHSDRLMIGSDTWVTERWEEYGALMEEHRRWLARLPPAAARAIAYGNAVRLFGAGGAAFPAAE